MSISCTFLAPHPAPVGIMNSSCAAYLHNTPHQPASGASAAQLFGSRHRAQQVATFFCSTPRSSQRLVASAALHFCLASAPRGRQHHEHQLPTFRLHAPQSKSFPGLTGGFRYNNIQSLYNIFLYSYESPVSLLNSCSFGWQLSHLLTCIPPSIFGAPLMSPEVSTRKYHTSPPLSNRLYTLKTKSLNPR